MKCPRDQNTLVEKTVEKKNLRLCPACRGLFIGLAGPKLKGIPLSKIKPSHQGATLVETKTDLLSPFSNKPMKHFVYQGVNLDYCKESNSVWMDRGELEELAQKQKGNTKIQSSRAQSQNYFLDATADGLVTVAFDLLEGLFDGI